MTTLAGEIISEAEPTGYTPSCDPRHWWEPHFNSKILERHWKKKVIEFLQRRYRIALVFIGLFTILWVVFFSIQLPVAPVGAEQHSYLTSDWLAIKSVTYSSGYIIGAVVLFFIILILLALTFWKHYRKIAQTLSVILSLILMSASCILVIALFFEQNSIGISTISLVAQFAISAIVVLVVYTLSRLGIWLSVILCFSYVVILETLTTVFSTVSNKHIFVANTTSNTNYVKLFTTATVGRLLFHICLNIAGVTTAYLSQIRLHDTFWRIGQCVLARRLLDLERDIEEKTIHSMLPRVFAEELLSARVQIPMMMVEEVQRTGKTMPTALRSILTPFKVCTMDRVSILYADIVEFTRFSSNLSAAELVGILNEIFSEFDELALKTKCEKITTLGDSYICVSGCPKPDSGHADNCVEMGISIVKSLEEYRERTNHPIQMRIGIHTGSVICGVLGTKRFKFDVWSRDVTIANCIESVGKPGRVLISSATKMYLSATYMTEEIVLSKSPPELQGLRLYYASRYRCRSLSIGSTSMAWKQRIREIESIGKGTKEEGNDVNPLEVSSEQPTNKSLRDVLRKRSSLPAEVPVDNVQPCNSLRDSLSRQSHLQRCASYTELANPRVQQEVVLDHKIVELMEAEKVNFESYFDPRLQFLTASFGDRELEARYRNYGRDLIDPQKGTGMEMELGFHLTKISYLIDVVALILIFILIMTGSAINLSGGSAFLSGQNPVYQSWLIVLVLGLATQSLILTCVIAIYAPHRFPKQFATISQIMINWYARSFVAILLIYYPMSMVIISLTRCYGSGFSSIEDLVHVQMSLYITIIVLICSINFMEVSYIAKIVGGALSAALTVCLLSAVHLQVCKSKLPFNETTSGSYGNRSVPIDTQHDILSNYYNRHVTPEAIILFLLILAILIVVNRMSEVSVRLSFIGRIEAAAEKQFTRQQKNQVEWLLFNIIPPHVALELRKTGKYSCNHDCVGIVFASIVNFSDITQQHSECEEESFRLLNRIFREYDMLLDQPQFSLVDKIKTIGSTYMAASGLNLPSTVERASHLVQIVNFALQLNNVLRKISILVPGFAFRLRIGFNYGPVTSGVVGSRKLMYDIWGDAVNVASRMESTGQVFKIHMPESCLEMLEQHVTWEFNRIVNVKGKGNMRTVFVTGRK